MSQPSPKTTLLPAPAAAPTADDPFRYGWRFVHRPTSDDPSHLEQVPLTLDDALHAEVGDFIVHSTVTKPTSATSPMCYRHAWNAPAKPS